MIIFDFLDTKKTNRLKKDLRYKIHEIIFEADTKAGRTFDFALLALIIFSIVIVMLDSVTWIHDQYGDILYVVEWIVTILFSIEYILRIYATKASPHYVFSFYGLVDFLAILPTYLSLFLINAQFGVIIRSLRLLRIFRILKLAQFIGASRMLWMSLRASKHKIFVFLGAVITISIIMGSIMYIIEGPEHGFNNIPQSIYWAIVTLTTVGYGDIAPQTPLGQALASMIMIMGYAIIAIPTGIISVEMAKQSKITNTQHCLSCGEDFHVDGAKFCIKCGGKL